MYKQLTEFNYKSFQLGKCFSGFNLTIDLDKCFSGFKLTFDLRCLGSVLEKT